VVVAVTGDDEDNVIICQLAREKYGVETTIARVNDPRNQPYFDLLGSVAFFVFCAVAVVTLAAVLAWWLV
jgi:Trk K+ transport system NAD-binding subunit